MEPKVRMLLFAKLIKCDTYQIVKVEFFAGSIILHRVQFWMENKAFTERNSSISEPYTNT